MGWNLPTVLAYRRRPRLTGSCSTYVARLHRTYLREHRSPTLIAGARTTAACPRAPRAYLRDLLAAGHCALETHLDEIAALTPDVLGRVHPA